MKIKNIFALLSCVLFTNVATSQYTHFNEQYSHGQGMQFAKCGENIEAIALREVIPSPLITKIEVDYNGNELQYDELILNPGGAVPGGCNPSEVILSMLDLTYVAMGMQLV